MPDEGARRRLVVLLRRAYSGELAAALAYAGHWRSLRDPQQRSAVRRIQAEELAHRARIHEMLTALGARPSRLLELRMRLTGLAIAALCFVGGWYIPMYGAGRIERVNIREYEEAAALAFQSGLPDWGHELLAMAVVEWDHERFFRRHVESHWLARFFPPWPAPPHPLAASRSTQALSRRAPAA